MILVRSWQDIEDNLMFIHQFEKLYLKYFPIDDEREPFENILNRIKNHILPDTMIIMETDGSDIVGGVVTDYYPSCEALEPIYIFVVESFRKHGIAKKLLDTAMSCYPSCKDVYLEVDNPWKVDGECSVIDPFMRLEIYKKLGFEVVPINYIQPPLGDGKDSEDKLLLLHKGEELEKGELKRFLFEFYKGLNNENSPDLEVMYKEIDKMP